MRQSERYPLYEQALAQLRALGRVYACSCTRGDIGVGADGVEPRYAGTCRLGARHPERACALRLLLAGVPEPITVQDRLQGELTQDVEATIGDFVLRRRDGFWAYQLAVVVDDAEQAITDVVRGLDLWDNTPRQRVLQRVLSLPTPRYLHLPLVVEHDGAKLSKSLRAVPASAADAPATLTTVLEMLRHPPPAELRSASVREQLRWAARTWDVRRLAALRELPVPVIH